MGLQSFFALACLDQQGVGANGMTGLQIAIGVTDAVNAVQVDADIFS